MGLALLTFGWVSSPAQNRLAQIPLYSAGGIPLSSAVADFHGDGRSDIVSVVSYNPTPTTNANQLTLLTANVSGGYDSPRVLFQLPANQNSFVASGDFNGDGKQDFALASSPSNTIKVYLGNGDGTFQAPKVTHFSGSAIGLYAGTVDRGNRLDLVLILSRGSAGAVAVFLGNGDGTFESAKTTPTDANSFTNFALADVNLDGVTDILVGDNFTVSVLLGKGDGTFRIQKPIVLESYLGYSGLVVSDFDGDGKPDLLFADPSYDAFYGYCGTGEYPSVYVLKGYGDGSFNLAGVSYDAGNGGAALALGDWNGDGKTDLAVVNALSSTISITAGTGSGFASSPWAKYAIGTYPYGYPGFVGADVNGDGREDLLLISGSGVSVLLNRGGGNLRAPSAVDVSSFVLELQSTDFNRDGFWDLSILGPDNYDQCKYGAGPGGVYVGLGSARGLTQPRYLGYDDSSMFINGYSPSALSLGDFNGNGTVDIALNSSVLFNNGKGQFTVPGSAPAQLAISGHTQANYTTAAGDFNRDGISDLATVGDSLQIRLGKGNGKFKAPVTYSLGGTDANAVLVRDLTGDGKLDIISVNYGTSTVSVFLGNGNGTFRAAREFAVTKSPVVVTTGDFNGDGKLDLAVASHTRISILLGNGAGEFNRVHDFGAGVEIEGIAAVELRGNGIADLVVVDNQLDALALFSGIGNGTFAKPILFGVGSYPTTLATGDFNGDGAVDVAVAAQYSTAISMFYNQGGTRIELTSSNSTPKAGQSVTFSVTVAASLPGNGSPSGSVTFKDGTAKIGTAILSGGKATLSYSLLSRGTRRITATYGGNANFNLHVSEQITETVH
jgi:hypothetical protein